jgi:hypothetical protein
MTATCLPSVYLCPICALSVPTIQDYTYTVSSNRLLLCCQKGSGHCLSRHRPNPLNISRLGCPTSLSPLRLLPTHNLPPLRHHMRKQNIRPCTTLATPSTTHSTAKLTRYINRQNQLQQPSPLLPDSLRWLHRFINQPTLTTDTQRIQHPESIIPQPAQEPRQQPTQAQRKEPIPNHLRDAPRDQHTRVRRALSQEREGGNDTPD